ncbi:MAG: hypothetical protein JXR96_10930 [Deltaproteobacteria bacterium]|nr:hypothetical protein [Deltaproteobacteria bacterium]
MRVNGWVWIAALALSGWLVACSGSTSTTCTEGERRCSGTSVQQCESGAWVQVTDCADTGEECVNGECSGGPGCTEGEHRCDGDVVQVCESGAWVNEENCLANGQVCADGACVDGPTCTDGQRRCDGDVVQECEGGSWTDEQDCVQSGQTCYNGACVDTCTEGTHRCDGDTVQVCLDGDWADEQDCLASGQVCEAGACVDGTCTDGQRRCDGDVVQECTDGAWVDQEDCLVSGQVCEDGACVDGPTCTDGQRRCDGDVVQVCEGGAWVNQEDCSVDDMTCADGHCTDTCIDGQRRCDGDTVQECAGGTWVDEQDCSLTGQTCEDGACVGGSGCPIGERRCDGDTVQLCTDDGTGTGYWVDEQDCSVDDQTCVDGACVDGCTDGARRCEGDTVQLCTDSMWADEEDCTENGQVCEDGACVSTCDPLSCSDMGRDCGFWDDGCGQQIDCGECSSGYACDITGHCQLVCVPGTCAGMGKDCGFWSDGCGHQLNCGACDSGYLCEDGVCQLCQPSCGSAECGPDGCGGTCGTCDRYYSCVSGRCVYTCEPSCVARECGPDGCGGSCGSCPGRETCVSGTCLGESWQCQEMGQCILNGCTSWPLASTCVYSPHNCPSCVTNCTRYSDNPTTLARLWALTQCLYEANCWPDNPRVWPQCLQNSCASQYNSCMNGCVPDCSFRDCGSDGCGGSCGTCGANETCSSGQCIPTCAPNCSGRECGPDPNCNLSCGDCPGGEHCEAGVCVEDEWPVAPVLSGPSISDGDFLLSWTYTWHRQTRDDYFELWESETSPSSGFIPRITYANSTSYASVSKAPGTYYYKMRARDNDRWTVLGNVVTVEVQDSGPATLLVINDLYDDVGVYGADWGIWNQMVRLRIAPTEAQVTSADPQWETLSPFDECCPNGCTLEDCYVIIPDYDQTDQSFALGSRVEYDVSGFGGSYWVFFQAGWWDICWWDNDCWCKALTYVCCADGSCDPGNNCAKWAYVPIANHFSGERRIYLSSQLAHCSWWSGYEDACIP